MVCNRCGAEEDSIRMQKRLERGVDLLCRSCVAKPAKTVSSPFGKCLPWHGAFDLADNPLDDDGNPYLPGARICNHSDCVNRDHIIE